MASIISVSIDLTKIDKNKIIPGKNGAKYYPLTVMVQNDTDQYGNNVSVVDKQSKEEVKEKAKKTYLGNGKIIWTDGAVRDAPKKEEQQQSNNETNPAEDDLPF